MADFMENSREMSIKKRKRNHRAQEMADFLEKCRKNEHQKNTNETTALKKWPILWKIAFFGPKDGRDSTRIMADLWSGWGQVGVVCVVRVWSVCVWSVCVVDVCGRCVWSMCVVRVCVADPSLADPALADPSLADQSLADPSLADPSLGNQIE